MYNVSYSRSPSAVRTRSDPPEQVPGVRPIVVVLPNRSVVRTFSLSLLGLTRTAYHCSPKPAPDTASHSPPIQLGRIKIPEGVTMSNLENVLRELREERKHAQLRVEKLDEVIRGLVGLNGSMSAGRGAGQRHTMSASARRRISLAQKARWARVRGRNVVSIASKRGKRTLSAAGRKRIAAAQRARWAKVRAQQKKAA